MVRVPLSRRQVGLNRLLTVALVVVTVLPIAIFATNFTESGLLRSARQQVRARERRRGDAQRAPVSDSVRREQVRVRRAEIHPTAETMVMAMGFQLVMIVGIGIAGRRLFVLRL